MNQPDRTCLKLSAYVTAHSVLREFDTPEKRNSAIQRFRLMGITKAYIESYRGGLLIQEDLLMDSRDHLVKAGFQVSGGIATTHGDGFTEKSSSGNHWVCYSSRTSLENLERASRVSSRIFDEVIIDDFLCTACRCSRCRNLKGDRSWEGLYRDLLYEFTKTRIIVPAKEEKSGVKLIIKYPQWYDRFHNYGYDVVRQSDIFDAVWVGTEIRDPRVDYVYQYQPFANYTYLRSVAGSKVEGAWFDFLWCYPEIYLEQAYQSILAGASELILFSYGSDKYDIKNPNAQALMEKVPRLERLCDNLRGKINQGIEAYKPPGSGPGNEAYIFDYLGLNGLPLVLTHKRPDGPSIFLPIHSLHDPDVTQLIAEPGDRLSILATAGFLDGLANDDEIADFFGLRPRPVDREQILTHRFAVEGEEHLSEEKVLFSSHLRPRKARVISAVRSDKDYPVVTVNVVDGVKYIAACLDTFRYMPYHGDPAVTVAEPVSLIHLPQAYLDSLRELVLFPSGINLKAPSMVGIYLYSDGVTRDISTIVLENFGDRLANIEITGTEKFKPLLGGEFDRTENSMHIKIPGRELNLLNS